MVWLVIPTAGCGRANNQQFARYGEAGVTYAAAMDRLLLVSRDLFVDQQSEELLQDRELAFNQANYEQRNQTAKAYIEVTEDLRRHTQLMARYFALLQKLATSDAPARTGEALQGTAAALNGLGNSLRGRPLLGEPAVGAVGNLTQIVVSARIRSNLRSEFEARKDVIRQELATQQLLLRKLSKGISADLTRANELQRARLVTEPLRSGDALKPGNQDKWIANRRMNLTATATVKELDRAAEGVAELQGLYEDLVQGKVNTARINIVLTDLETLLSATESLKKLTSGAQQ